MGFHHYEMGAWDIFIHIPKIRVTLLVQKTWEYTSNGIDDTLYL